MDDSFQLRVKRLLDGAHPAPLDHAMLTATLAAQRAANAQPGREPAEKPADPLTEIVLAGPAWRQATSAQSGCFSRAEVRRRLNPR